MSKFYLYNFFLIKLCVTSLKKMAHTNVEDYDMFTVYFRCFENALLVVNLLPGHGMPGFVCSTSTLCERSNSPTNNSTEKSLTVSSTQFGCILDPIRWDLLCVVKYNMCICSTSSLADHRKYINSQNNFIIYIFNNSGFAVYLFVC